MNSLFVQKMIETAAFILITFNVDSNNINDEVKESWITKLLIKCKEIKELYVKIEELEYKTLKMLNMLCRLRLNQQVI